ncbi:hypothetical protein [Nonomuraea sp. NPDC023979]|uniref:hypothetical protein n=1 Tax=Nonomuraea sp. NPDC023979 TaxID=3154796 RepID=UPI0033FBEAEA
MRSFLRLCVCGLLLAGCGSPGDAAMPMPTARHEAVGIAAGAEARQVRLPLDAYALGPGGMALMGDAAESLTAACMAAGNLAWPVLRRPVVRDSGNRRRYGLIEAEVARRAGYEQVMDPAEADYARRRAARDAGLTAAQRIAAYGRDGKGGCLRRSWERVTGPGYVEDAVFVWRLSTDSLKHAWAHPKVKHLMGEWRICMRGKGFHELTRKGVAEAVADVACKTAVGLVPALVAVETGFQERAVARHGKRLSGIGSRLLRLRKELRELAGVSPGAAGPARPGWPR